MAWKAAVNRKNNGAKRLFVQGILLTVREFCCCCWGRGGGVVCLFVFVGFISGRIFTWDLVFIEGCVSTLHCAPLSRWETVPKSILAIKIQLHSESFHDPSDVSVLYIFVSMCIQIDVHPK